MNQQPIDYSAPNAYNSLFPLQGNSAISQPIPYVTAIQPSAMHGMNNGMFSNRYSLAETPQIIAYQQLVPNNALTIPSYHAHGDKPDAPLELSYYPSDPSHMHAAQYLSSDGTIGDGKQTDVGVLKFALL